MLGTGDPASSFFGITTREDGSLRMQAVRAEQQTAGWRRGELWLALGLLAPSVVYLFAMSIYPTIYSLWLAFHNYTLYRPDASSFAAFGNFTFLFGDDVFRQSFWVTLAFAVCSVALEFVLGLAVAVLLDRKMAGIGLLRTMLIVPVLISPVGMGLTFRYILAPSYGLLNYFLGLVGLPGGDWIVSTTWALPIVVLVDVWQWTPFVTLILLSGMQSVSQEVTEAAELDGLSEWQKLRRIVLPIIKPIILVVLLIRLIDAVRSFDLLFVLTHGGPGSTTEVLSIFSYETGFTAGDIGTAAAIAWITVVFVNILVVFFIRALSRTEAS
jgi:multiple sugar transport system permease protein